MEPAALDSSAFRPLLQSQVLPGADGAVVLLEDHELSLAGDPAFVRQVLERCDGTETLGEIADDLGTDARELVTALAGYGAVVDCARAWERFHFESSVASGLFRAIEDADLMALLDSAYRPGAADSAARVDLTPAPTELARTALARASAHSEDGPRAPTFEELSAVLAAAYGRPPGARPPVPSAGGFYPLALHVVLPAALSSLDPGLWWFDPPAGALVRVGDHADPAEFFVAYATHDGLLAAGNPVIVVSADVARQARKYSNRAYRFALMEAGAVMQMAYLAGAELGLPIRAIGGVVETASADLLGLPEGMVALLGITVGT